MALGCTTSRGAVNQRAPAESEMLPKNGDQTSPKMCAECSCAILSCRQPTASIAALG